MTPSKATDTPVVFIGAGNLATNLAKALYRKGFRIVQVYSRTRESAETLASLVNAGWTIRLSEVVNLKAVYIVSLKDDALPKLLPRITAGKEEGVFAHTSGSLPLDIWQNYTEHGGVLYPLQTFSKQHEVDFKEIPFFVEAFLPEDEELLKGIASVLSEKVMAATSEQRRNLHIAAVFACNFTNHMYALAADLLESHGLPFEVILPLIDETARKVHKMKPEEAQTGPAVRYDGNIINKHLAMLEDEPSAQDIYRMLTQSIFLKSRKTKE